jgi:mannose-1-phosphate guanylyltransferase/phosphomannomutase
MAGGEGSRLRPLTCHIPKPMVPVLNRPVMEYTIELLKKHGITEVGVTLQYLPEEIKDWFGDGSKWGVSISYFTEDSPLGTAGSVKNAESFLDDTFIVISGDALTDFDLGQAITFHQKKRAIATLVLTSVENPLEYGVVLTHSDNKIDRFLEKPGWGEVFSDQVNTGIYILEPEVLRYIPANKFYDFSKNLFPLLLQKKQPVYGCLLKGYWCDIGNMTQYMQANYDLLSGNVGLPIKGNNQGDNIWLGEGVKLNSSVKLKGPLFIGNNVEIGKNAVIDSYSVIGDGAWLGQGSVLKRAVLWNNVYLGKEVAIRGSVICNNVIIKNRCQTYEGAVVGWRTIVEEESIIKPEVKVWPAKQIEQGAVLHDNLVWGTKANKYLFGAQGVFGISNRDITPEFTARLGAAYGTMQRHHAKIVLSSDHYKVSQMLKTALTSGLVSAGVTVYDLGESIMPVHRFAVRSQGVDGGIHIKVDRDSSEKVWIQFVDKQGIDLGQGECRKIENIFSRGDFRRVEEEQMGAITYTPRFNESYQDYVMQTVDIAAIRENHFKVVLDYDKKNLSNMIPGLLDKLGVKVVALNSSFASSQALEEKQDFNSFLAEEVLSCHADFGVMLDSNGEKISLIDDKGNLLDEDRLAVLYSLIIFKTSPGASVVAPVTVPQVIEKLAGEYGGKVVRTKTAFKNILDSIYDPDILQKQGHFNQTVYFDGILMLVKIMEYIAANRTILSQLNELLPAYYVYSEQVYCSWENKGKVMRQLIQDHKDEQVELLDGIKVKREDGWVLVLPDVEKPQYHIFSEAVNQEVAEELTNFYKKKIQNLQL